MNSKLIINCLLLASCWSLSSPVAYSQHPSQVEIEHQREDHFAALINFDKIPKRKIGAETRLTVANSSWALSLPNRALTELDLVINSDELDSDKIKVARFQKAIIHYQEERYDEALMIAKKLASELDGDNNLHSKVHALIAHCLISMGSTAQAEEALVTAFTSAPYQYRSEFAFQLGELLSMLGRWDDAESYLKTIESSDERAGQASRLMIEINFSNKSYQQASKLFNNALETFPDNFKDPWSYYARGVLAAQQQDLKSLDSIMQEAQQKLAPSDIWLNMLEAEYEISALKLKESSRL